MTIKLTQLSLGFLPLDYFNIKEKVGVLSPTGDFLTTNFSMFFVG